jgi:hypothetical protein
VVVVVLVPVLALELLREDKALVDKEAAGLEHDLRASEALTLKISAIVYKLLGLKLLNALESGGRRSTFTKKQPSLQLQWLFCFWQFITGQLQ